MVIEEDILKAAKGTEVEKVKRIESAECFGRDCHSVFYFLYGDGDDMLAVVKLSSNGKMEGYLPGSDEYKIFEVLGYGKSAQKTGADIVENGED